MSTSRSRGDRWREGTAVVLVVLAGAAYLWMQLRQGWIPHDEGTLGQSALRVLRGELPHADFDAMYTGGLAVLNALAFEVAGARLMVPRVVLWGAFVLWLPASYWIARRFAGPLPSAAAVLLMVVWSVPNYPAAMPSWYNLFLATLGTAALIRYLDTRRRRWLVAAGVCGGLSVLFKIIGVYFLAAAGLFLVALEQSRSSGTDPASEGDPGAAGPGVRRPVAYRVVVAAVLVAGLAVLARTVDYPGRIGNVVYFVLPVALLIVFLAWAERSVAPTGSSRRFRGVSSTAGPLLLGAAVPVALYLVPYVARAGVDELLRGLFVLPVRRLSGAATPMPGPRTWGTALVFLAPAVVAARVSSGTRWIVAATAAAAGGWIVLSAAERSFYRAAWTSIRPLLPLVVAGGVALLARRHEAAGGEGLDRDGLAAFAVLAVVALCSLVQFPFGAPIYFMYVGPLLVLGALAALSLSRRLTPASPVVLVLLCLQLIFAARWLNTGFIKKMGLWYKPSDQTAKLDLTRAKLLVSESEKGEYERLVAAIRDHGGGPYIYAGPDSPEVYFLAGRRNPTRALFEFLSVDDLRGRELLDVLGEHDVGVVAINRHPSFSDPLEEATLERLRDRYPRHTEIGHFILRWR